MMRLPAAALCLLVLAAAVARLGGSSLGYKSTYLDYRLARFRQQRLAALRTSTTTTTTTPPPSQRHHHWLRHRARHHLGAHSSHGIKWFTSTTSTTTTTTAAPKTTTSTPEPQVDPLIDFYQDYTDEDGDVRWTSDTSGRGGRYKSADADGDDEEDEDEEEDDEEEEEDEDDAFASLLDDNNDDMDEDPFYDDEDWQAEQASITSSSGGSNSAATTTSEPPPHKSLSDWKWTHLGTRSRVEETRRNGGLANPSKEVSAAIEHVQRVQRESDCRIPRPRVVPVQQVHPDPSKHYHPQCTVLHRCGSDTGCCKSVSQICGPRLQHVVSLYLYTATVGQSRSKVERLEFSNHTECACMEISEYNARVNNNNNVAAPTNETNLVKGQLNTQPAPESITRCNCPKEYQPKEQGDNCKCVCSVDDHGCLNMSRGTEYFSLNDRMCIIRGKCKYPTCEYGTYLEAKGRCPRKYEKFEALAKTHHLQNHQQHHHTSSTSDNKNNQQNYHHIPT